MKNIKEIHWYDSIIRPLKRESKQDEKTFYKSLSGEAGCALPLIEEWGSPEDYAA